MIGRIPRAFVHCCDGANEFVEFFVGDHPFSTQGSGKQSRIVRRSGRGPGDLLRLWRRDRVNELADLLFSDDRFAAQCFDKRPGLARRQWAGSANGRFAEIAIHETSLLVRKKRARYRNFSGMGLLGYLAQLLRLCGYLSQQDARYHNRWPDFKQ
jgi:hypothetical protein